jgi:hypothetical protein
MSAEMVSQTKARWPENVGQELQARGMQIGEKEKKECLPTSVVFLDVLCKVRF